MYYNNKAAVFVEKKDFDTARELSHKAVEVGRSNRADYTQIAKSYSRIATCYEKEQKLDEGNRSRNKQLEWVSCKLTTIHTLQNIGYNFLNR